MPLLYGLLSLENFIHAFAGAFGSCFALSLFYPLDTARVILQASTSKGYRKSWTTLIYTVYKEGGLRQVYRGWNSMMTTQAISSFVYFYGYNGLKPLLEGLMNFGPSNLTDLLSASLAGCANVLITNPLWVVNVRLKLLGVKEETGKYAVDTMYTGIPDALYKIANAEGFTALWSGVGPSLILVINPAVNFMVYESLKRQCMFLLRMHELSSVLIFAIGAISKAAATIVSYPAQLLQTRMRLRPDRSRPMRMSLLDTARLIFKSKGVMGFYSGMDAKLLQTVFTSALMFLSYERIVSFFRWTLSRVSLN